MKRDLSPEEKNWLIVRLMLIALTIAIVAAFYYFKEIWGFLSTVIGALSPFLLGLVLAFLELPIARSAEHFLQKTVFRSGKRQGLMRMLAGLFSVFAIIVVVVAFLLIVLPEVIRSVGSLAGSIGEFIQKYSPELTRLAQQYDVPFLQVDGETLAIAWEELIAEATSSFSVIMDNVMSIGTAIYQVLFKLFVGLITSLYLITDRRRMCAGCKKLTYALLPKETAERAIYWTRRAAAILTGFISGKALDSVIMGLLVYACNLIFNFEYALLIAAVIAVTNMIPFFGPFIGAAPSVFILFLVNPYHALGFLIMIVILQQIDGNILGPKILGEYVGLSPLLIMIAIVAGGNLFGFVGMLLGVPVAALLYAMVSETSGNRLKRKGMAPDTRDYLDYPPIEERTVEQKKFSLLRWLGFKKK